MNRDELIDVLTSHIGRVCRARKAFAKAASRPGRVDSRDADQADYALCSFIERHGEELLDALRTSPPQLTRQTPDTDFGQHVKPATDAPTGSSPQ